MRIRTHAQKCSLQHSNQPSHVLRSDVSSYPVRHLHRNPPIVLMQVWEQLCDPKIHSFMSGKEKIRAGVTCDKISPSNVTHYDVHYSLACEMSMWRGER